MQELERLLAEKEAAETPAPAPPEPPSPAPTVARVGWAEPEVETAWRRALLEFEGVTAPCSGRRSSRRSAASW
jgi:hypothetical protein